MPRWLLCSPQTSDITRMSFPDTVSFISHCSSKHLVILVQKVTISSLRCFECFLQLIKETSVLVFGMIHLCAVSSSVKVEPNALLLILLFMHFPSHKRRVISLLRMC